MKIKTEQPSPLLRTVLAGRKDNYASDSAPAAKEDAPPFLARRAVESYVRDGVILNPEKAFPSVLSAPPSGCFVCIKTVRQELRGCIGTVVPVTGTLAEEIIANAISAATQDPRFVAVSKVELPSLRYSVDVLEEPEPAEIGGLDPKLFGVIVEDKTGLRRGLLLPDIEGVETAAQQVQIASRKAGLAHHEICRLYRFRVRRFREPS